MFQTDDALRHSDNNLATNMFIYFNHLKTWMAERPVTLHPWLRFAAPIITWWFVICVVMLLIAITSNYNLTD
ncbi:hypothetical protein ACOZB2_16705 [Pantoea endophytica]